MSKKQKYITLLVAPGIPSSEVKALKKHWQEAERDPDYSVVLNYDCIADMVRTPSKAKFLVVAPGVPVDEVLKLRKDFDKALRAKRQEDRVVVCNYECRVDVLQA
jgi:hypothetical protein